jgi:hypothetical protein
MITNPIALSKLALAGLAACLAIGLVCTTGNGQTPGDPPKALQDFVALAKESVPDEIILANLRTSAVTCVISAEDILYLKRQGVSQDVILALMDSGSKSLPTPTAGNPLRP